MRLNYNIYLTYASSSPSGGILTVWPPPGCFMRLQQSCQSLPPFKSPNHFVTELFPFSSQICSPNSLVHVPMPCVTIHENIEVPCHLQVYDSHQVDLQAVGSWILGRRSLYMKLRYSFSYFSFVHNLNQTALQLVRIVSSFQHYHWIFLLSKLVVIRLLHISIIS